MTSVALLRLVVERLSRMSFQLFRYTHCQSADMVFSDSLMYVTMNTVIQLDFEHSLPTSSFAVVVAEARISLNQVVSGHILLL